MGFLGNFFKPSHDKEPKENPTQKPNKENPIPPESLKLQLGALDQFSIITQKKSHPAAQKQRPEYFWPIGKIIGGIYPIHGYLGCGGFGQVYRCYDEATYRDIAVKIPHPVHPETQKRFVDTPAHKESILNEVRNWIDLAHPNIVHAFDVRDDQSTDYLPAIFMEACDGGSLQDYLLQNSFTLADRIDAAIQVCWAMEYAHIHGLLHLDLKPQNILMTSEGIAKVTDFGLARAMTYKSTGISGTPLYMAPEQWNGSPEKSSDIYSFGVMLYYMVYGRWPFIPNGKDDKEAQTKIKQMHCSQKPKIPAVNNNHIPAQLSELILNCLAKESNGRPKDFAIVSQRLCDCYNTSFQTNYLRIKPAEEVFTKERISHLAWALIRLGIGCNRRGDLKDAMDLYHQAQVKFEEIKDQKGIVASLGNQGNILYALGRLEEAMKIYKQCEDICKKQDYKAGLAASFCNQGLILKDWGQLEEAMKIHKQEEAICRELGDKEGLSASLGNQGNILYYWSRLEEAMQMYKQCEAIFKEFRNKEGLRRILVNKVNILRDWGRLEEAMKVYKQEEALCRDIGDKAGLAKSLGNQGNILYSWGRPEEALQMYMQQEVICKKLGDQLELSRSLGNQGNNLYKCERLEEAMKVYKQCEDICRKLDYKAGLPASIGNQGKILEKWGLLEEAMQMYKQYETISKDVGDKAGLAACLGSQGFMFEKWERLEEALECYKQQEPIYRELGDKEGLATCLGIQGVILERWGQLEEAMQMYKQYETISRDIGDKAGVAACLGTQGVILEKWDQLEEALKLYKQQETIRRDIGDKAGLAKSLINQAELLAFKLHKKKEALIIANEAYEICKKSGLNTLTQQIKDILDKIQYLP